MKSLRSAAGLFLAIVVLAFVAVPLTAQVQNGQITGDVTDPSGATVPNAAVTVKNPQTGYTGNATANNTGHFVVNEVPVGTYVVSVSAPGFKTLTRSNVAVHAGTIQHLDAKLQVGQVNETVEVTGAPPQIDVETSRLAQVVNSTQVSNLPLNGRNIYDLIQVAPGAVNVRGVLSEQGANTVVNGIREDFNGFLINGVSNKDLSGGNNNQPIQDTVQEFQQLTLNMSAQYGSSAGTIVNLVTKSGTNAFHGSAWEFNRNDIFDANNFFINQAGEKKPKLRFNQFGGTLGGPIVKDKVFFFGSYQGDRFTTTGTPVTTTVESPAWRQAVAAANPNSVAALLYQNFTPSVTGTPDPDTPTIDQYVAAQLGAGASFPSLYPSLGAYLCPTNYINQGATLATATRITTNLARVVGVTAADQAGCASPLPIQAGTFDRTQPFLFDTVSIFQQQTKDNLFNGNEASIRLDFTPTQKDRIFTQFNWQKETDKFGPALPDAGRGFLNPLKFVVPNFQFSYVRTFTPTVVNEFRAGYTNNSFLVQTNHPGVPFVSFDDGSLGFGSYNGYPQFFKDNVYSYSDMVSISHGKHNMKIGADVRRNLENSEFNVGRPSYYFFDPLFFAMDMPYGENVGVDPGIVSNTPAQLSSNIRHFRNWEIGAYFQDDWKVTRRLTLNLGLRYDLYTRHTEENNLTTTFLLGPGRGIIDNISSGAGQIKDANVPAGDPGCDTPTQIAQAQLAGVCGSGGFAKSSSLGQGDHNNFGPRVGFALDVFGNGKTSLRGGFGVSYESTLYNPLSNSRWNLPYYSFNNASNFLQEDVSNIFYGPQTPGVAPSFTGPPDPANFQGTTGPQAIGNLMGWDPTNANLAYLTGIIFPKGVRDPYVYNYFFGTQHEIANNLVLEVNYVGTTGHKLFRAQNVNRIPGARLPEGVCVQDNFGRTLCGNGNALGRLNPNYGTLRVWENVNNSNYNALQASLRKQAGHGITFNLNYTWSHAIDNGSTWHSGATSSNGPAAGEGYSLDQTLPNLDRGNSIFDIRHRLVANFVWELPWLKAQQGFVGHVLGGWQWNGIVSYQSGAHWSPFTRTSRDLVALLPDGTVDPSGAACAAATFNPAFCVNQGGDYNLDGENNDRPSAIANHWDASHNEWANGFNLPTGFFFAPCLGCAGNLTRNTFVGPNYASFDTSLFKNIKVTERVNMQFRWEVFNALNRTNFELPGAESASHSRITNSHFGQAGAAFPAREMQLGLKIQF